jgi:uncharacterized membrane protein
MGQGIAARESTMGKMSAPKKKKKLRGFPHVFYIWKFQKSPFWATWSSGGVVISIVVVFVVVFVVVVIVIVDLVSKGRGAMQKAKS